MPKTDTNTPCTDKKPDTDNFDTCTLEDNILRAEKALQTAANGPIDYFADYHIKYAIANTLIALTKLLYVSLTEDEQIVTDRSVPLS